VDRIAIGLTKGCPGVVYPQDIKPDKDSGIVNDANDWTVKTMGNPRYRWRCSSGQSR
jgi:hypothetical protein